MDILDWKPDKSRTIPLHIQIADFIRNKIAVGEWPVGSSIPTQRQLTDAFDVNRSTIVTALEDLTAEGLLAGNGRMGTVVLNNTWSLLNSMTPLIGAAI